MYHHEFTSVFQGSLFSFGEHLDDLNDLIQFDTFFLFPLILSLVATGAYYVYLLSLILEMIALFYPYPL